MDANVVNRETAEQFAATLNRAFHQRGLTEVSAGVKDGKVCVGGAVLPDQVESFLSFLSGEAVKRNTTINIPTPVAGKAGHSRRVFFLNGE